MIPIKKYCLLVIFLIVFSEKIDEFTEGSLDPRAIQCLVHILFAGIFPLTAVAYGLFQRGARETDLTRDLELLGIERNTETQGDETGDEFFLPGYGTVASLPAVVAAEDEDAGLFMAGQQQPVIQAIEIVAY